MVLGSMALRHVTPRLNGADGYLRWKESTLLALYSAGVAHVLSDDPPPLVGCGGDGAWRPTAAAVAVAKQWERDDAVCRGHILAALSDRLLPDYARHATAAELWRALARTYDVDVPAVAWRRFTDFQFDQGGPLLEQVAHAEALGFAGHASLSDGVVAGLLCEKLPARVRNTVKMWSDADNVTMETIWAIARAKEESRLLKEGVEGAAEMSSSSSDQL